MVLAIEGDNTPAKRPKKALPEALAKNVWQKGQPSANPGGRPKGSRNKFAEEFIKDFLADWEVAGPSAIQMCRLADPAAYLRIAASLIPKEFSFKPGTSDLDAILDQLSDEQLAQFHGVLAAYSDAEKGRTGKASQIAGS